MRDRIDRVARHLEAQRETGDSIAAARSEQSFDLAMVQMVLERLRQILLDQTPADQLEWELEVAHGLVAKMVGHQKASQLIDCLPVLRHCTAMDVQAAFDGDPAAKSYSEVIASYPSSRAVSTYRIAHAFYDMGEPVIARLMSEDAHSRTGIDIHPGAQIGCHFFIDHGTGVVIGETCVIGDRAKLYHGVTLGAFSNKHGRADKGVKRHPTLEDDVTIYPNATILGGETVIGAGSVIGGNAWLTHSIPPGSRVVTEPPKQRVRNRPDRPASDLDPSYDI